MSLAPSEWQALAEIEQTLSAVEPKLAAKMATFASLAEGDTIARWKSLSPWRSRLRYTVMAMIGLVIVALFVFAVARSGAHAGPAASLHVR